ncbi:MAG TPA: TetR/AcrR family transcriptional regulator [Candidatus Nanopelagicales bacterium]|nr:TetR/AcrR family transcriptional regulator [Candidatus Nanopelagicales bacterium]
MEATQTSSKSRRRQRIIDAAADVLVNQMGPLSFEDVAHRAGVSRRTVYNHFPGADDLIIAVGSDVLQGLVDSLNVSHPPEGEDDPSAVFADVATSLRDIDLVDAVVRLTRILGATGYENPRIAALVRTTFIAIADRMTSTLTARHPTASPFEIELMVSSLIGGVLVVYTTWAERVGVTDTARSRKVWSELFDIHLRFVRDGYLAASRSSH